MSYNPNYPGTQPQYGYPNSQFNDPFFQTGNNQFNMDIREEVEDPMANMNMDMGLMNPMHIPDINAMHRQMMGNMQRQIEQMNAQMGMNMNMNMDINSNNMEQMSQPMEMPHMPGSSGKMFTKTYCSKVDYTGGVPKEETYQTQAIKQFGGPEGHSISEKQEAYKNTMTGVQKASHQRLLDNRGTKTIKERNINTGEQSEHNLIQGMTEGEVNDFNNQFNDYRQRVNFQDNYRYLNGMNRDVKQLGSGYEGQKPLYLGDGSEYPKGGY